MSQALAMSTGMDVTVELRLDGGAPIRAKTMVSRYGGNRTWTAVLPPTPASFSNHTVAATMTMTTAASTTTTTITLVVLFGEVWVCSGQSDMETDIGGVNNSAAEEASMASLHHVRLFHVGRRVQ